MADVPMATVADPVTLTIVTSSASCADEHIEESSCRLVCIDWVDSLLATRGE